MISKHFVLFWFSVAALPCAGGQKLDDGLREAVNQLRYRLYESGPGTFRGENPEQRLSIAFTQVAARFEHLQGTAALRLRAYGYGGRLRNATQVNPVATDDRVEYRRGELTEWYKNEAVGIEQGFTLKQRPGSARDGEPLVLALRVEGSLIPTLSSQGDAVLLGSALRYGGLRCWDTRGQVVPSSLQVRDREIRLVIDDRNAEYPFTVDPVLDQQAELTASDLSENDEFGWSVSVSGDTAVVGAPNKNGAKGVAYVFVRSQSVWTQQQELTASDGVVGDMFGWSVSVNANTVVVGAPFRSAVTAYVFVRNGSVWMQQGELIPSDEPPNGNFGTSVSISGNTAVVGDPFKNRGTAYVFVRNGNVWTQQQELDAPDGVGGWFGYSVSVNGNTILVGAPDKNTQRGAAYVFVFGAAPSGPWTQQQELTASDPDARLADYFGWSVSVDGDTALIGAYNKHLGANDGQGAAYVFARNGSPPTWTEQQELSVLDGAKGDEFGYSVSVSGNTAVVGALSKNNFQGAGYVFVRNGGPPSGLWTLQQELTGSDGTAGDRFGRSVSISGDTVLAGAYLRSPILTNQGAAYVFLTIGGRSVTPNSGGGLGPQTFTGIFTDPYGASDLQVVYLDFGNLAGAAHSCFVIYVQASNALYLYNDTNSALLGPVAPGTANTVSNSQCTLSGVGGTVSRAGQDLLVTATIAFAPGFTGPKSIFGLAQSYSGFNGGWQTLGNWTAAIAPPLGPVSVTPNGGSGLGPQTFTVVLADPNGASDIQVAYVDFSATGGGAAHSCFIAYVQATNALYLFGDTNSLMGPITPGTGATLSNSQCTLTGSGGIVTASGSNLTISLAITFSPIFAGSKGIFASAQNYAGQGGFELLGTWTPTTAALGAQSVSPINGSGFGPLTFNAVFTNPSGGSDIQGVYLDIGTGIFAANSCIVAYIQASNLLTLLNDASNGAVGYIMAGSNGALTNSQCTLKGAGGTVSSFGTNLTVPFAITFNSTFTGSKNVFGVAQNNANTFSAWSMLGVWTP